MRYIFQSNSQRTSYYILQALAHKKLVSVRQLRYYLRKN